MTRGCPVHTLMAKNPAAPATTCMQRPLMQTADACACVKLEDAGDEVHTRGKAWHQASSCGTPHVTGDPRACAPPEAPLLCR